MSLIQVELALKQATSKSLTPVSMHQLDPGVYGSISTPRWMGC